MPNPMTKYMALPWKALRRIFSYLHKVIFLIPDKTFRWIVILFLILGIHFLSSQNEKISELEYALSDINDPGYRLNTLENQISNLESRINDVGHVARSAQSDAEAAEDMAQSALDEAESAQDDADELARNINLMKSLHNLW